MNQPKIPNWVRHRFVLIPCLAVACALLGGCSNPAGGGGSNPVGEVRVTNATGSSYYPFLAWTGTEYGVVWYDNRDGNLEIYFARLDPEGRKIGSDVRITTTDTPSALCTMAWTGTEFGIVWLEEEDPDEHWVHFTRVSSIGEVMGRTLRVGPGVGNIAANFGRPTIAWDGTNYGILWYDLPPPPDHMYTIFGRAVSPEGRPVTESGSLKAGSHQ